MNSSLTDAGGFDPRRRASERSKIRTRVIFEWRSAKRYDYTDAELNAETERRLAYERKLSAAGQAQLPLIDTNQPVVRFVVRSLSGRCPDLNTVCNGVELPWINGYFHAARQSAPKLRVFAG